ncbi:N-acetylmuramoyl-L-alanine amidase [Celerinatantimonas yamalensis]|uniref:N-acetylmuramoyl-L-alanine amidase n=1 Tax=Celerinatantimonas yamalensis TaxID=559956 RepID=A0ABW9G5B8_9GAMM
MMQRWLQKGVFAVVMLIISATTYAQSNQISDIRVWSGSGHTRVVLELNKDPQFSFFRLRHPDRLVVDLADTDNRVTLSKIKIWGKLLKRLRQSNPPKKHDFRLVLDLSRRVKPAVFPLPATKQSSPRLVIDLPDNSPAPQAASASTGKPVKTEAVASKNQRDIIIVIDAGHGGKDTGAIGPNGIYEKNVTLPIAKRLAALFNREKGLKGMLTRNADYFIPLDKRSQIARQDHADMLISIHADGFSSPEPHGASVWVLSERRANREINRWLDQSKQPTELLGGAGEVLKTTPNDQYLAHALLDMSMDHSMNSGFLIATDIVNQLRRVTYMHKDKPQHASLAVLKAPDIPSMLVETGFITNPREERELNNPRHQQRIANAIFTGVRQYYRQHPPLGTWYALHYGKVKYVVKRGDSLSLIAKHYQTSVDALKQTNQLKNNRLAIGQVLIIPKS